MTDGPLADLPSLGLEDAPHRALVELQQTRYGPVAERGILLDQLLDRRGEALLDLRCRLDRSVLHGTARNVEPTTELRHRYAVPVLPQALLYPKDQVSSFFASSASHFLGTRLQHRLAVRFLQRLELHPVLLADVLRLGLQRVLYPSLGLIDPGLDLLGRQIELTGRLAYRGFPLDDFKN